MKKQTKSTIRINPKTILIFNLVLWCSSFSGYAQGLELRELLYAFSQSDIERAESCFTSIPQDEIKLYIPVIMETALKSQSDLVWDFLSARGIYLDASTANQLLQKAVIQGDTGLAKKALASGADPDYRDEFGRTELMKAVYFQVPEIVTALIEAGADISLTDHNGLSVFAYVRAPFQNMPSKLSDLPDGAPADVFYKFLEQDLKPGYLDKITEEFSRDWSARTVFHWLTFERENQLLMELFTAHFPAPPVLTGGAGEAYLVYKAESRRKQAVVQLLEAEDLYGGNPVFLAIYTKNTELLGFFIECGINVNGKNQTGFTFAEACLFTDYVEGLRLLISSGLDSEMVLASGKTVKHELILRGYENLLP